MAEAGLALDFDLQKVAEAARAVRARCVALQFPEGLLSRAWELAAQVEAVAAAEAVVLGEPAFGACCADDVLARALGAQLLVHFGHSRVVPRSVTDGDGFVVLYVPVVAAWDVAAAAAAVSAGLSAAVAASSSVALVTTAQFLRGLPELARLLESSSQRFRVTLPQTGQLAPGEILGCTAPRLRGFDAVVFVGDGRFHVEAAIIASPQTPAFRYDPYTHAFTRETLETSELARLRSQQVDAVRSMRSPYCVGIAVSTLGRQASPAALRSIERTLDARGIPYITVLLDDVSPPALARFPECNVWVQLACPRLSIDWSSDFPVPVLTSHEAILAFGTPLAAESAAEAVPMDNWSTGSSHYREEK